MKIGLAITGSFCTHDRILVEVKKLLEQGHDILPIVSGATATVDTRFGQAKDFLNRLKELTGNDPIDTLASAEPVGPKNLVDVVVIAPCTGNTLAKIAHGITDTVVTMATKSQMRTGKPVVIALSTNDALGLNLTNIATLLNTKDIYFVPFGQDEPYKKPKSLVAHFDLLLPTVTMAMEGKQIQPLLV